MAATESGTNKRKYSVDDSDPDERDDSKRKNRNSSEKKRRDVFNNLINELSSMVTKSSKKMDKGSVLQATIAYLRNYRDTPSKDVAEQSLDRSWFPESLTQSEFNRIMLEGQDAFTICISYKGHILYVSDAIASLLGYVPQYLRSAIFNIVHEDDHAKVYSLLKTASAPDVVSSKDLNLLFTTTLHLHWGPLRDTPAGQTAAYEPFKLVGYFKNFTKGRPSSTSGKEPWHPCYVAVALPLRVGQISREMMIPDGTTLEFISRHSLEWKFLLLDSRAADVIGYLPFEIIGTSGYDYYHIDDLLKIVQGHRLLLQKGEGTSCHYRFLTKGSQWVWLQTRYYISYQQWSAKPEYIVCTHRVLSYSERDAALKACRSSSSFGSTSSGNRDLTPSSGDGELDPWQSFSSSTLSTPYGSTGSCSSGDSSSSNSESSYTAASICKSSRTLSESSLDDEAPMLSNTESWLLSAIGEPSFPKFTHSEPTEPSASPTKSLMGRDNSCLNDSTS